MKYKLSYDYSEMLQELEEELADGILKMEDFIQILRGDEREGYRPIIDWYYSHDKMIEDLRPDVFDEKDELELKDKIRKLYEKDRSDLCEITVMAALVEMEDMNKII